MNFKLSLKPFAFALGIFLLGIPTFAHAETYTLDADHTSVNFKVKHLLTWVKGSFDQFEGTLQYNPENLSDWFVEATISAKSIDTGVDERDRHLRGKDFFDVEKYPKITFKSTKVEKVTDGKAQLHGLLNLHGIQKEVVLDLEILGTAKDPWGNSLAAFSAETTINRKDFGIVWNKTLDSGGLLVGEEVKISIEVEAMKQ